MASDYLEKMRRANALILNCRAELMTLARGFVVTGNNTVGGLLCQIADDIMKADELSSNAFSELQQQSLAFSKSTCEGLFAIAIKQALDATEKPNADED